MRFLIITHVLHKSNSPKWFAYAPYVREMNLWLKHVHEVEIVAPVTHASISKIDIAYQHNNIKLTQIPVIAFNNINRGIKSLLALPLIIFKLWHSCKRADHIHLRCPGNMGLLGCLVQIFFPKKIKTAKYAGNWDPKAKQPLSYRFQKWLLSSRLLTKNMTVLVYGEWRKQSKNIKPFFTATYRKKDVIKLEHKSYSGSLNFIFIGSLVTGKRPLLAIKIIENLHKEKRKVSLDLYGDGALKQELESYIINNNLSSYIKLHGNESKEVIQKAIKTAHFSILPSKSEGWPKALAESMFFGTIPIATHISCVPYMLAYGERGILIEPNLDKAVIKIKNEINNQDILIAKAKAAKAWSEYYTLDLFEKEISKLIKK